MGRLDGAKVSREKELLLCAARCDLARREDRFRELITRPLDWRYVLDEAANHSLRPLLFLHLQKFENDVPAIFFSELRECCRANVIRSLFLSGELYKVLDDFREQGIPSAPYKGPIQAAMAYGDVTLREFADLDIILRQCDITKAHQVMLGRDYRPKFPWLHSQNSDRPFIPGEYSYIDKSGKIVVELHTEHTLRHFPAVPDLNPFLRRMIPIMLAGKQVHTFSAEDLLPFLCVHGSKDFWERLIWVADVAELVRNAPNFDWDRAMSVVRQLGVERMTFVGIILAGQLLDLEVPDEILRRSHRDKAALTLATLLAKRLQTQSLWPMSASERFRVRVKMVKGKVSGLRYATRLSTTPAEGDVEGNSNSPAGPVQSLLRPYRLLRKYRSEKASTRDSEEQP